MNSKFGSWHFASIIDRFDIETKKEKQKKNKKCGLIMGQGHRTSLMWIFKQDFIKTGLPYQTSEEKLKPIQGKHRKMLQSIAVYESLYT